jgi:hypothetical protein
MTITFNVTNDASAPVCTASGTILREYWANVTGGLVSNIPLQTPPTSSSQITSFEAPANTADNYGQRIRGYLCAPATGNYTFYIASDDDSELWLSPDESTAGKKKIASVSGWTFSREWTKHSSQKSATIALVQGKKYYIEALHKEGAGGDNLAVGWILPNTTTIAVIAGSYLSPFIHSTARVGIGEELPIEQVAFLEVVPNPFSSGTEIEFVSQTTSEARLEVYNASGLLVRHLFEKIAEAGTHYKVNFDGAQLASGLYYVKLTTSEGYIYKKIVLAR